MGNLEDKITLAEEKFPMDVQDYLDSLFVQDASNPRGVAKSLVEFWTRLADTGADTESISNHPVTIMFINKLESLVYSNHGDRYHVAYTICRDKVDMNK